MKLSSMSSIRSYSSWISIDTAAWPASDRASSTSRSVYGSTLRSADSLLVMRALGSDLRLPSASTPTVRPRWSIIGTISPDFV